MVRPPPPIGADRIRERVVLRQGYVVVFTGRRPWFSGRRADWIEVRRVGQPAGRSASSHTGSTWTTLASDVRG